MTQTLWTKYQQATERQEIGRLNTADLESKKRAANESNDANVIRGLLLPVVDQMIKQSRKSMEVV
jgi:hypothetical protein